MTWGLVDSPLLSLVTFGKKRESHVQRSRRNRGDGRRQILACLATLSLDSVCCLAMDNALNLIQRGSNHLIRRRCQQVLGHFAAQKTVI